MITLKITIECECTVFCLTLLSLTFIVKENPDVQGHTNKYIYFTKLLSDNNKIISSTSLRHRSLPAISEFSSIASPQSLLSFKISHYSNVNSSHHLVFVYSYIIQVYITDIHQKNLNSVHFTYVPKRFFLYSLKSSTFSRLVLVLLYYFQVRVEFYPSC